MTETIAMIGVGTMGAPMARNLLKAGFPVRVWNRTREKAVDLQPDGAVVASTPADAARGASIMITMLYDGDTVAGVAPEALRALDRNGLWLQMTTVGPDAAARLQQAADQAGIAVVDAPVLGTKAPAEAGKLTVLAAGPDPARDRATSVFDVVGGHTIWVDAPQGGQRLKLVANTWVLTAIEAVAEALRLARGLGVDPALFTVAISGTATDQPYAHIKAKAMLDGDFTPSFTLDNALKDARLIRDSASGAGVDVSLTDAVERQLARASEDGYGDKDVSAVALAARPRA